MALGIPCISTDCKPGGAREIITDGVDGIIVPRNEVSTLAKAMDDILSNTSLSLVFSERALLSVRRFNSGRIYDHWELFFSKLYKHK